MGRMSARIPVNPATRLRLRQAEWAFTHPGTNGYVSTWGQVQAGVAPPAGPA